MLFDMKKLAGIFCLCALCICANAQTTAPEEGELLSAPEGYEWADSLVFTPMSAVDDSLDGCDIFTALPENVTVNQSPAIRDSLMNFIQSNRSRNVNGYRIRIFFDNKQDSRTKSEVEAARFRALYPGYGVYRSFANPFFKVAVGDFRTKAEANAALRIMVKDFPAAFVIREKFRFPALDPESFSVDTVRVLRKIEEL